MLDVEDAVSGPSRKRRASNVKRKRSSLDDVAVSVADQDRKPTSTSPRKKAKPVPQSLEVPHPAPANWEETYNTIRQMRAKITAPVDTMGCERAQDEEKDAKSQRFSTLVSLMLSSQTKDEVTDAAVKKLRAALGGSITIDAVIGAAEDLVSDAINKVGFWRRKTTYIKKAAQMLKDEFNGDVPKTVDELCSLPGVGPKMAFLALQVAWKLNSGIGVDVHVHRITNRLGWHKPPTKNPEETSRLNLQSWLPKELHPEINHMLVGFGQTVCLPIGPRCDLCELPGKNLCPSARKVVNVKMRKVLAMKSDLDSATPQVTIAVEEDTVAPSPIACKEDPDEPQGRAR
ncbi:DNA glycosylase [Punctularia strigosozonata HHB-11173 SS5]|uniref:DNA glycosylase n=1 Tax=Punctularia strigosozonata (strain HHB-11173) TaxID=741275 RepID=UPI000441699B|nr:DNA glycosylase [Punctularia strigosozonata HHB-11173 SS5]EIN07891.1 DNA glycosylase [Punctularia strigosozonata HHB-11173 SS5]